MRAFTELTGLVAPLDRVNVDTDAIIPKQFLRSIKRTGYGANCFDEWRYLDRGDVGMDNSKRPLNPDFSLNLSRYQGAEILLTRKNFGCGSSREHAPWALAEYGFRALLAPSFADIFFNNCYKNGLLPIELKEDDIARLFIETEANVGYKLAISLPAQTVTTPAGEVFPFTITEHRKYCLINGLDEIGLTLENKELIKNYEQERRRQFPWLFSRKD